MIDYICIFPYVNPEVAISEQSQTAELVVKVRRYRPKKQGKITVLYKNKKVMTLVDDGNGLDIPCSERLDYVQLQYLTCALRAYAEENSKFARSMIKIDLE